MTGKRTPKPEAMLLRVIRVAEILAKVKDSAEGQRQTKRNIPTQTRHSRRNLK